MKTLPVILSLLSAAPAFACFDRDAKPLPKPYEALREYERNNRDFSHCLDKLERVGVNLREVAAWRKDRPANETGPVIYSILIQGKDGSGQQTRLTIDYNLKKHTFVCGAVSNRIPRCF